MIAYIKKQIEFILSRKLVIEQNLYINKSSIIEFTTQINLEKTFTLYREK